MLNKIHKDFRPTWLLKAYDFHLTGSIPTRKEHLTLLLDKMQPFIFFIFIFFMQYGQKVYQSIQYNFTTD